MSEIHSATFDAHWPTDGPHFPKVTSLCGFRLWSSLCSQDKHTHTHTNSSRAHHRDMTKNNLNYTIKFVWIVTLRHFQSASGCCCCVTCLHQSSLILRSGEQTRKHEIIAVTVVLFIIVDLSKMKRMSTHQCCTATPTATLHH